MVVVSAIFLRFGHPLMLLLYDKPDVVDALDDIIPVVTVFIFLDGLQVALNGVITGAGYQAASAPFLVVAYWVVGLSYLKAIPLSLSLSGYTSVSHTFCHSALTPPSIKGPTNRNTDVKYRLRNKDA